MHLSYSEFEDITNFAIMVPTNIYSLKLYAICTLLTEYLAK